MGRADFMKELTFLLQDLDDADREEALQYYNDYFEDAGPENEEQVIRELGSPKRVAAMIRDGLTNEDRENGAYTDFGYEDQRFDEKKMPGVYKRKEEKAGKSEEVRSPRKKKHSALKVILILVLCLCGIPIFAPLAAAAAAVILVLLLVPVAVVFGVAVSGIAIVAAGVAALIGGIVKITLVPATGILMCGIALLIIAAGVALTWLIWKLFCRIASPILNRFIRFLRRPFERKGESS